MPRAVKGIGFNGVTTYSEEFAVNLENPLRVRERDCVAAVVEMGTAPVGVGRVAAVDVGAHGAVEDHDALVEQAKKLGGHFAANLGARAGSVSVKDRTSAEKVLGSAAAQKNGS